MTSEENEEELREERQERIELLKMLAIPGIVVVVPVVAALFVGAFHLLTDSSSSEAKMGGAGKIGFEQNAPARPLWTVTVVNGAVTATRCVPSA